MLPMLQFVLFLSSSVPLIAGTATNVAEKKPAWMSSAWDGNHPASRAVDGDTRAHGDTDIAHTGTGQSTAWWKVDLQTQVQSARIILYFRTNYIKRRNGLQLYTSGTNSSEPTEGNLCHTVTGRPDGKDIPDVLNVTCPGTWRYLTVYTETANDGGGVMLDFAEVQVWSTAINVAEKKPAWMSSAWDGNHPASRAVDGDTRAHGYTDIAHTGRDQSTAWWKVDLQTQVQSARIILYFRTNYIKRRNGVHLYTSGTNSSDPKEGNLCHTVTGRPDGTDIPDVLNVTCLGTWRYLTVYTETANDGGGVMLDFAEVQVWSTAINVAEKKPAWMSSAWDGNHPASRAVDGDTRAHGNTDIAHTGRDQSTAWWKVDLQTQVQSARIILYFRTNYIKRRNGVQLYTSGTNSLEPTEGHLCHTVTGRPDGTDIDDILIVTCLGTWRYLSVYTETDNDGGGVMLDFAEVQMWTCSADLYGVNCNKAYNSRHCDGSTEYCDSITGACSSGMCQTGWAGKDCTACSAGLYGVNCNKACNSRHCDGSTEFCDSITGACSSGICQTGWAGKDCTACSAGLYGVNCNKACNSRHCNGSTECDSVTGACSSGMCQTGWAGTDCTACTSQIYGPNCGSSCSARHCKTNSTTCDGVSGECPGGCEDGWTEIDCSDYGQNCHLNCADRHCTSASCLADGACSVECEPGWTLLDCTQECPSGTYGISCNKTCGQCAKNETCHHISGNCPGGCEAGWQRGLCQKPLSGQSGFPVAAVAGTVAGLLVAIIVIVAVVLARRSRRRFHDSEINEQVECLPKAHSKPQQENVIYENVTLVESAAVNQKPAIELKPATQTPAGTEQDTKDQEEEDVEEEVQSPDSCYYNAGADDAIRDVAVSELAATVETLKERKDGFEKEYHRLPTGFTAPYQDSQKPENSGKNKFRGYYPYDHNRVRLTPLPDVPGSDYINASFMHNYNQGKTYIASQAPNKKTVGDFWRMIWQHSCSHVVMLTGLMEECRVKCERYWPAYGVMETGGLKIEVEETQTRANFTTRHMKVTSNTTGECRSVIQFHFTSWPDHGVPDTLALVNYIWLVRRTVAETDGPLLVHCSAGIGRTGTYIAVDSLIDQARGEGLVDVLGYVTTMRGQRKNMIQTSAQYECVFLCLLEMTTYGNTSMEVSNYTNSYSSSGMDTTVDGKTFSQLSEMLVSEVRGDPPDRHRMWVDGNPDFIVRVGPSLTRLKGYLQANSPPPGLVKLLWKLVEENNVHSIIVVTPNMGLVQAEGRSKTHGEITVTTTSETSLSTDLTMNNLQLATKTGRPRQVKMIRVDTTLTTEVMTSYLLNHVQLQEISTQLDPVVVLHSDNDRKLAVAFCIMGNILPGIREEPCVDVIGHVRTFLRCCPDLQFNENDVQMFHDFALQCILRTVPSNTYANI